MTEPVTFRTTIAEARTNATGIVVPPEAVESLASGKKPAVVVTVEGYTYRSTVASMGGRFLIPVSAEHRAGSGVVGGQDVEVTLALDTEPRVVEVPADLREALDADDAARASYESLSFSRQRALVEPIGAAKTSETRARRLAAALAVLTG
ncbi:MULTISPECIES: YdeI/OmpD-associated family protein [unclassified Frigoribacterium]|jgi:hypothetical protein|uniref:YdeI/OmpD-associated family protein n=1 Tax=unclassified Frigoribacterium TaxID=2627005 RepID=UPI0007010FE4|nr:MULTISPECIES: YdeI/OmpD-associated family protein [unclassified Frigoribacterium]KQO47758.1 hypothetical protein ASF07_09990 [Frigoribacterium sp. Leaf254]KQT39851.1 hypothetical protein ASG28_09995 [Frigoribacterium sp. Leaf415]OII23865.1 hypothetical protein BIV04_07345 [Frigoribacterium sp. MCBA15_019]